MSSANQPSPPKIRLKINKKLLKVEHDTKPSKKEKVNSEKKPTKPKKEKKSKSKEETVKTKPIEQPTRVLSRTRKPVNYMEDRSRSPSPYVPSESIESETAIADAQAQQSSLPDCEVDSIPLITQQPTNTEKTDKVDHASVSMAIAPEVIVSNKEQPQQNETATSVENVVVSPPSPPPPTPSPPLPPPVVMTKKKAAASKAANKEQSSKTAKKSAGKKLLKSLSRVASKVLKGTSKDTNTESSMVSNKESPKLAMSQKVQHDHPPIVLRISKVSAILITYCYL